MRIPAIAPGTGYGLAELVRRAGDFAIVAACAVITTDGAGVCRQASLAIGGVGPHPLKMRRAEGVLAGGPLTDRRLAEAADVVPGEVAPESDVHATAAYRRAMARVMAYRALAQARARAAPGPGRPA